MAKKPSGPQGGRRRITVTPPDPFETGELTIVKRTERIPDSDIRKTTYKLRGEREWRLRKDGKRYPYYHPLPDQYRFDQPGERKGSAARRLAQVLREKILKEHPLAEKKDYRDQHFIATYTGMMEAQDPKDPDHKYDKKSTFGTRANADLDKVVVDLQKRLKALAEGETPQTIGPKEKYGKFSSGAFEIELTAMDRETEDEDGIEEEID